YLPRGASDRATRDVDANAGVGFARGAAAARELAACAVRNARPAVADETHRTEIAFVDDAVAVVVDRVALLGDGRLVGHAGEGACAALHRAVGAEPLQAGVAGLAAGAALDSADERDEVVEVLIRVLVALVL